MTDNTVTLTERQFEDLWHACHGQKNEFRARLPALGFRIIDDAPPEGVVKLAREIADEYMGGHYPAGRVWEAARDAALTAFMHARKAAEAAQPWTCEVTGDVYVCQRALLRELGGEG